MSGRIGFIAVFIGCALLSAVAARAQGRGNANWTTAGYDAQRSFWVRTDPKISADSLSKPGFGFLWKIKLEGSLTAMVVLDPYIGSLLSGYKVNRFNWLELSNRFSWESDGWRACRMGVFSKSVTLRICRIW